MENNCWGFQLSEEPEQFNDAIPFSTEESGEDYAGASLPNQTLDFQQCILERSHSTTRPRLQLILSYGNLEQQEADVIAAPLLATRPYLNVLNVTKDLQSAAGEKFSKLFDAAINGRKGLPPGSNLELPIAGGSYLLKYKSVNFVVCNPWDGFNGSSVKNLKDGIYHFLERCNSQKVESVLMSAIGTGAALKFPNEVVATIIGEEIKNFVIRHSNTTVKKIKLVIKKLPESDIIFIVFRETLLAMDLGEQIILQNEGGACFRKIRIGEYMTKNAGRLYVSVVYDDIVKETTNAIVNSTNFKKWSNDSVAHAIFSAAGAAVVKEAQESRYKRGSNYSNGVLMTKAGHLKCGWILHCDCEGKLDNIKELVESILERCDDVGLKSVAIPAIGTGESRLCPKSVANHIMKAICSVARNSSLRDISTVRLITHSPCVYHIFCSELNKSLPDL
ncbi:protein mono-ADP-ribosyltransferase PARP14-like [Mixophyes fleayi]|uniref:protein mono-ADP-ribosyltransferase PARP14-like n=1 Tax=Mixophyes fleayi TaxID=3061075 RepID=UPI003F4E08A9